MALEARYKRFLATPTAEALAPNATLTYVPTVTTISQKDAIVKHIRIQGQELQKKSENVLHALESSNSLCVETETTIHFTNSGGVFLPNLDDHLVAGRTVTLVIVHIVTFDSSNNIERVRLLWDQGSLLKSVDIVGRSGRNWPLHGGAEQCRVILSTLEGAFRPAEDQTEKKVSKANDAVRELFSPRTTDHQESPRNAVAPRESAKPASREYAELFNPGEIPGPISPNKIVGRKSGAGLNFSANRLFDQDENLPPKPASPSIKTNPNKFNHFEFNEPLPASKVQASRPSKLTSQWDYADFYTPPKAVNRVLPHTSRNFEMETDGKVSSGIPGDHKTPQKGQARAAELYENKIFGGCNAQATTTTSSDPSRGNILGNTTNTDQNRKMFESKRDLTDDHGVHQKHVTDENARALSVIGAKNPTWQMYDESPPKGGGIRIAGNGMGGRFDAANALELMGSGNLPQTKGIRIAGNGMGGRSDASNALLLMSGDLPQTKSIRTAGNGMAAESEAAEAMMFTENDTLPKTRSIRIAGNGMGGKSDASNALLSMESNSPPKTKSIRIAGNGMGGKSDAANALMLMESNSPPKTKGIRIAGNGMGGKSDAANALLQMESNDVPQTKGIRIAGNGMGGRAGTSTLWEF